jgi:hypothetical protein
MFAMWPFSPKAQFLNMQKPQNIKKQNAIKQCQIIKPTNFKKRQPKKPPT